MTRLVLILAIILTGCSSSEINLSDREQRPADFTIDAVVHGPANASSDTPRVQRSARYIVEPDGVLRAALGDGASFDEYPWPTRTLTPRQSDSLWRLARDGRLLNPSSTMRIDSPHAYRPPAQSGAAYAVITFIAQGQRQSIVARMGPRGSASANQLIDRLAALAWIPE